MNRQMMGGLRDRLVEITAQGQTVQVGQSAQVRDWLDLYGGDSLMQQRQKVGAAFSAYQQAHLSTRKTPDIRTGTSATTGFAHLSSARIGNSQPRRSPRIGTTTTRTGTAESCRRFATDELQSLSGFVSK